MRSSCWSAAWRRVNALVKQHERNGVYEHLKRSDLLRMSQISRWNLVPAALQGQT